MNKKSFVDKLIAPIFGNFPIFTKGNLKISDGYEKLFQEKNFFVEILPKKMIMSNLEIPNNYRWKENDEKSLFVEYRSKDYCRIKILFNKNNKKFYILAKDVTSIPYPYLIKKKTRSSFSTKI